MTHQADFELAARAAQADTGAFDRLFGEALDRVHAFVARRAASPEAAEQMTERILVRVFDALGRYDGSVPLSAWVLGLTMQELRADAPASRADIRPSGTTAAPASGGA